MSFTRIIYTLGTSNRAQNEFIELLKKYQIDYLGKELGGYRSGGYEAYTKCEEFIKGRKKAEDIAKDCEAAVMCSERQPFRCHRRFIGRSLADHGWRIIHIIDQRRAWEDNGVVTSWE